MLFRFRLASYSTNRDWEWVTYFCWIVSWPNGSQGRLPRAVRTIPIEEAWSVAELFVSYSCVDQVVPCSDMAGEIIAIGEGVNNWKVGDRVCANFALDHLHGDTTAVIQQTSMGGQSHGVLTQYRTFPTHVRVEFSHLNIWLIVDTSHLLRYQRLSVMKKHLHYRTCHHFLWRTNEMFNPISGVQLWLPITHSPGQCPSKLVITSLSLERVAFLCTQVTLTIAKRHAHIHYCALLTAALFSSPSHPALPSLQLRHLMKS